MENEQELNLEIGQHANEELSHKIALIRKRYGTLAKFFEELDNSIAAKKDAQLNASKQEKDSLCTSY